MLNEKCVVGGKWLDIMEIKSNSSKGKNNKK